MFLLNQSYKILKSMIKSNRKIEERPPISPPPPKPDKPPDPPVLKPLPVAVLVPELLPPPELLLLLLEPPLELLLLPPPLLDELLLPPDDPPEGLGQIPEVDPAHTKLGATLVVVFVVALPVAVAPPPAVAVFPVFVLHCFVVTLNIGVVSTGSLAGGSWITGCIPLNGWLFSHWTTASPELASLGIQISRWFSFGLVPS